MRPFLDMVTPIGGIANAPGHQFGHVPPSVCLSQCVCVCV